MHAARMSALGHLLWKLECRLNRRLPFTKSSAELARCEPRGASLDLLAGARPPGGRSPSLCVVLITYARAELCTRLLEAVHASLEDAGLLEASFVVVIEDRSETDYAPVLAGLDRRFHQRFAFYATKRWLGKKARAGTYQAAFNCVRALGAEKVLFIEDDVEIERSFVRDALARWDEIRDPKKVVLYLTSFDDDEPDGRWIRFRRQPVPGTSMRLTQWFDLQSFLVDRRFFELLRYEVFPSFASRWDRDPGRSCGISEQFTRRVFGRGDVYQVERSLAFHGQGESLLNPEARAVRALDNRRASSAAADELERATPEPGG